MAQRDDKRLQRKLKRQIKRAGTKHRRQTLKEQLRKNPEEAAQSEETFGRHSSESLNGQDQDSTRRREDSEGE
jgi:hypothetical protein